MTSFDQSDVGLVTVDEAAAQLGVAAATIRQWRRRYSIRSIKSEGRVLLSLNDLWRVEQQTRRVGRGSARQRE